MGFLDIVKIFAKDFIKEGAVEVVKQAPGLARDGAKLVKAAIANRQNTVGEGTYEKNEIEEEVACQTVEISDIPAAPKEEKSEEPVKKVIFSNELYEITRRINSLTKELNEEKEKNSELAEKNELLKESVRECQGVIDSLSKKLSALESENGKISAQLGAVNEKINLINGRIPSKVVTWAGFFLAVISAVGVAIKFFM